MSKDPLEICASSFSMAQVFFVTQSVCMCMCVYVCMCVVCVCRKNLNLIIYNYKPVQASVSTILGVCGLIFSPQESCFKVFVTSKYCISVLLGRLAPLTPMHC